MCMANPFFIIYVPAPTLGAREIALRIRDGACIPSAGEYSSSRLVVVMALHYSNEITGLRFHASLYFPYDTYNIIFEYKFRESPGGHLKSRKEGAW